MGPRMGPPPVPVKPLAFNSQEFEILVDTPESAQEASAAFGSGIERPRAPGPSARKGSRRQPRTIPPISQIEQALATGLTQTAPPPHPTSRSALAPSISAISSSPNITGTHSTTSASASQSVRYTSTTGVSTWDILTDLLNKEYKKAVIPPSTSPSPTPTELENSPSASAGENSENLPPFDISRVADGLRIFCYRQATSLETMIDRGDINHHAIAELVNSIALPELGDGASFKEKCKRIIQETDKDNSVLESAYTRGIISGRARTAHRAVGCSRSVQTSPRSPLGVSRAGIEKSCCKNGRCGCSNSSFRLSACTMETIVTILARNYM